MIIGSATAVQATVTQSQSTFAAANPGLSTLTFENIAPANGYMLNEGNSFTGVSFTDSGYGSSNVGVADAGFLNTPSSVLFGNYFSTPLNMAFSPGVNAVGFNLSTAYDNGSADLTVYHNASLLDQYSFVPDCRTSFDSYVGFYGYGQDITAINFTPSGGVAPLIDNLSFGNSQNSSSGSNDTLPTPEPTQSASLGLGAFGLAALAMFARKRRCVTAQ